MTATIDPATRTRMLNAVTEYDRKESRKRHYNPYALGHYAKALQDIDTHVSKGIDLRTAIVGCFVGRLADKVLKAAGLPLQTDLELRGIKTRLPDLEDSE